MNDQTCFTTTILKLVNYTILIV